MTWACICFLPHAEGFPTLMYVQRRPHRQYAIRAIDLSQTVRVV